MAVSAAIGVLVACSDESSVAPSPAPLPMPDDAGQPVVPPSFGDADVDASSSASSCLKMDLLFIIDDSGSMAEEQTNLANNARPFIERLDKFVEGCGPEYDYRIAVITGGRSQSYTLMTGLGDPFPASFDFTEDGGDGHFRKVCTMPRPWIERGDSDRVENFACATQVGTGGPSIEMPLEAMSLALKERVADGTNPAFLRNDALLAIVLITDADDCSRKDNNFVLSPNADCTGPDAGPGFIPPQQYVTLLDDLKGSRDRWCVAAIAAETPCESDAGLAEEAYRLKEFIGAVGDGGAFGSICSGDLTTGLDTALKTFDAARKRLLVK